MDAPRSCQGRIVRAEVAEREAAAREYDQAGRPERAQRLGDEASVLVEVLSTPCAH